MTPAADEWCKMIKHVVLWKLKENALDSSRAKNAAELKRRLEELGSTIPEIEHLEVGLNERDADAACDVALFSVFQTQQDFEAYRNHPAHRAVLEFLSAVVSERYVVDYEDTAP